MKKMMVFVLSTTIAPGALWAGSLLSSSNTPQMTLVQVVHPVTQRDKENFFKWIRGDNESSLKALLEDFDNFPIDERNADGDTGMHIAARMGKLSIVNLLLKHGADPEVPDSQGRKAKELAKLASQTEVFNRLHLRQRMGTVHDLRQSAPKNRKGSRVSPYEE
jgi:ankyrin repeat protein